MFVWSFMVIKQIPGGCMVLFESVDPDFDAMTPGNSRHALTNAQENRFSDSWESVPVIGSFIATRGLPMTLTTGLLIVSLYQVFLWGWAVKDARQSISQGCPPDPSRCLPEGKLTLYVHIIHVADAAGLLRIAAFVEKMAVPFGWITNRNEFYKARVPEMVFQTWFTVSVLEFTWGNSESSLWPIIASVLSSYAASGKALYDNRKIITGELPLPNFRLWLAFHLTGFAAITLRIVGLWACPSHDLKLSQFRCASEAD
jgi:hypothetical protein